MKDGMYFKKSIARAIYKSQETNLVDRWLCKSHLFLSVATTFPIMGRIEFILYNLYIIYACIRERPDEVQAIIKEQTSPKFKLPFGLIIEEYCSGLSDIKLMDNLSTPDIFNLNATLYVYNI